MNHHSSNYKINGMREVMYCQCITTEDKFQSMTDHDVKEFVDENLINKSHRLLVLEKNHFSLEGETKIECLVNYNPWDYEGDLLPQRGEIYLRFFEELTESEVDIDIENNLNNLELIINGSGPNELLKWHFETHIDEMGEEVADVHVFADNEYSFFANSKELNLQINSQSYGQVKKKKLDIYGWMGEVNIDLINDDISKGIEDFLICNTD